MRLISFNKPGTTDEGQFEKKNSKSAEQKESGVTQRAKKGEIS